MAHLNSTYVWSSADYRDEFRADAPAAGELAALIEEDFAGVTRGEGVTPPTPGLWPPRER